MTKHSDCSAPQTPGCWKQTEPRCRGDSRPLGPTLRPEDVGITTASGQCCCQRKHSHLESGETSSDQFTRHAEKQPSSPTDRTTGTVEEGGACRPGRTRETPQADAAPGLRLARSSSTDAVGHWQSFSRHNNDVVAIFLSYSVEVPPAAQLPPHEQQCCGCLEDLPQRPDAETRECFLPPPPNKHKALAHYRRCLHLDGFPSDNASLWPSRTKPVSPLLLCSCTGPSRHVQHSL